MKSRAALKAALLELVGERPFAEITATMIVERAGIGYATFFRHYRDPAAVLADVADQAIEELLAALVPAIVGADGLDAMRMLADYVDERRPFFRALLSGAGDAMRNEVARRIVERASALPMELLPDWLPRDLALIHMSSAVMTIVAWWLEHDGATPPAQVAVILHRLVIQPALAGRG